jgi:hypothetical protein
MSAKVFQTDYFAGREVGVALFFLPATAEMFRITDLDAHEMA